MTARNSTAAAGRRLRLSLLVHIAARGSIDEALGSLISRTGDRRAALSQIQTHREGLVESELSPASALG